MVGSAKLRKREHEKKKREQTSERKDGGALSLSSFFPPPLPEYKALNCPRLKKKTACTQGPHAHFCTRVQGLDLSFGHRPPLRLNSIAWYLKKGYVQQVAYSRNMPEHHYSVNAVFLHHFTIRYSSLSRALAPHRLIEGDSSGDPVSSHRVLQLPCLMFCFCQCF